MKPQVISTECPVCEKKVAAELKHSTNHILHLLLTFLTGGFWLIVWVILFLCDSGYYYCKNCGTKIDK